MSNANNRKLIVTDTETGEVIDDGSVSIRHKTQDDAYRKLTEKERYKNA